MCVWLQISAHSDQRQSYKSCTYKVKSYEYVYPKKYKQPKTKIPFRFVLHGSSRYWMVLTDRFQFKSQTGTTHTIGNPNFPAHDHAAHQQFGVEVCTFFNQEIKFQESIQRLKRSWNSWAKLQAYVRLYFIFLIALVRVRTVSIVFEQYVQVLTLVYFLK